ncbi:hypothetical protein QPK87_15130 [Kamptonema cortianum]|nr:hypothetical protein [Kamptonema cortianum]
MDARWRRRSPSLHWSEFEGQAAGCPIRVAWLSRPRGKNPEHGHDAQATNSLRAAVPL